MEIVHKEVRKNKLLNFNQILDEISFNNLISICFDMHNNNVHSVTLFKHTLIIKNDDKEIYKLVNNNIKKQQKIWKKKIILIIF